MKFLDGSPSNQFWLSAGRENDIENFKILKSDLEGKIVSLATADNVGNPNIIACEINKITDDGKIIITNNQMGKTVENIVSTKKAAILYTDLVKTWFRITGEVAYNTKGEWFDFVKHLETNKKWQPKGVLIIKIKKIEDIDKGEILFHFGL